MINLKKAKVISITNNIAKRVVAIILAALCFLFLFLVRNDEMFYTSAVSSPAYQDAGETEPLGQDFCFEQQFTPQYNGLSLLTFYYHNIHPSTKTVTLHTQILDDDNELVYEMSIRVVLNSGLAKANIPIKNVHLSSGKTYTLKVEPGLSFNGDNFKLPLATADCAENGEAFLNGASQGTSTLQISYRYYYFSTLIYILSWILAAVCCLLLAVSLRLSQKAMMVYNGILVVLVPLVTLALVEYLNYGNILNLSFLHLVMNLLLYYIIYGLIFIISNSLRASLISGSIIFYICGLVNHFTITFRGTTVLPSDLLAASTALKVFEKYQFNLSLILIFSFLILICLVQIAARANFRLPTKKIRLFTSGGIAAFSVITICLFMNTGFLDLVGLTPYQWKQTSASQLRGFVANFTSNIPSLIVKKPIGYDTNKLSDIAADNDNIFAQFNTDDTVIDTLAAPGGKKPNIIAIMNESFADLSTLGNLSTDVDPLEYFHSLNENVIKGSVAVPVFGAGTSNSEFEFLTGNNVSFLPFGCVPYQQFVNDKASSLVSTLNSQGYQSYAVHPYSPYGWARNTVYVAFGFKQFLSQGSFYSAQKERWYISDKSSYDKLIELYEDKTPGQPIFLFNVTMQNHGGYNFEPFTPTVNIQGYNSEYPDVEQYLSLIQASDDAFEYLVNYFKNVDEPTIICMFGDHLPKVDTNFYAELMGDKLSGGEGVADSYDAHQTPFIIWANYDLGIDSTKADFGTISVSYLSSLLLQTSNLQLPEYNKYLLNLMQCVPVITSTGCFDASGNAVDPSDENGEYYDMLTDYQRLQYNSIIDYKNRVDSIFFVPQQYTVANPFPYVSK